MYPVAEHPVRPQRVRFIVTPVGSFRLEQLPDGGLHLTPPRSQEAAQESLALRTLLGLGDAYRMEAVDGAYILTPLPASPE